MATKKKETNGKQAAGASITVEKKNLAKVGSELEEAAVETAVQGLGEVADRRRRFPGRAGGSTNWHGGFSSRGQRYHARAGRGHRCRTAGRVERSCRRGRRDRRSGRGRHAGGVGRHRDDGGRRGPAGPRRPGARVGRCARVGRVGHGQRHCRPDGEANSGRLPSGSQRAAAGPGRRRHHAAGRDACPGPKPGRERRQNRRDGCQRSRRRLYAHRRRRQSRGSQRGTGRHGSRA